MSENRIVLHIRGMPTKLKEQLWSFLGFIYQATTKFNNCQLFVNQNVPWPDIILVCQSLQNPSKHYCFYVTVDYFLNNDVVVNLMEYFDKYFKAFTELCVKIDNIVIYTTCSIYYDDWFKVDKLCDMNFFSDIQNTQECVILTSKAITELTSKKKTKSNMYGTFLSIVRIVIYTPKEYAIDSFPFPSWSSQYLEKTKMNLLCFQVFLNWLKDGKGIYKETLLNKQVDKLIEMFRNYNRKADLMTITNINMTYYEMFAVSFQEFDNSLQCFFHKPHSNILNVKTKSTFLTTLKIVDYLFKKGKNFILLTAKQITKLVNRNVSSSFESNLLIIECSSYRKKDATILKFISKVLKNEKRIIYISDSAFPSARSKIRNESFRMVGFCDHISCTQLSLETQDILLDNVISFQGYDITLGKIINRATLIHICDLLYLEKLIKSSYIIIGKTIRSPIQSHIYIQRTLRRQFISMEQLRDYFSVSCIVLVMGTTTQILHQFAIETHSWSQADSIQNGVYIIPGWEDISKAYEQCTKNIRTYDVFWLSYIHNVFFVQSFQSRSLMLLKHLSDVDSIEHINMKEFCLRKGVTLLADDPGIGKTVFLDYCAQELKNQNNYHWIIKINLFKLSISHLKVDQLVEEIVLQEILGSSSKAIAKNANSFTYNMLRLAFTFCEKQFMCPEIILIFDEFHAVSTKDQISVIKNLGYFLEREVSVFIAGRLWQKTQLEIEFQSTAYRLNLLNDDDKMNLLTYHTDFRTVFHKKENIYSQMDILFNKLNHNNFNGNPLNLDLLTRNFSEHQTVLEKFEKLMYSKINLSLHRVNEIISAHRAIAISILGVKQDKFDVPVDMLLQIGLLTLNNDDLLVFTHPYYQYYFVADHLSSKHVDISLLVTVFSDQKYQALRMFLDEAPPICDPSDLIKEFENPKAVIQNIMHEGYKNLVKYLLHGCFCSAIGYRRRDKTQFNYIKPHIKQQYEGVKFDKVRRLKGQSVYSKSPNFRFKMFR